MCKYRYRNKNAGKWNFQQERIMILIVILNDTVDFQIEEEEELFIIVTYAMTCIQYYYKETNNASGPTDLLVTNIT